MKSRGSSSAASNWSATATSPPGGFFLQRAAEAQDPRAALMLAMTYDPVVIEQVGIRGVIADADAARTWYRKAKESGSTEAARRLELLASRQR